MVGLALRARVGCRADSPIRDANLPWVRAGPSVLEGQAARQVLEARSFLSPRLSHLAQK
jgi:hypothetical protein